ncbi:hypothetical protein [Paraburkholderia caffeinilytica]|uniref:hypothetical protein n=1 Tax=Paraburkholderia caffeinilytica TaxID=1761016 RepID=UPI003D9FB527
MAIDGKTVRGSHQRGEHAIHLVSAYGSGLGAVLGQVRTADKSNEITAIAGIAIALRSLAGKAPGDLQFVRKTCCEQSHEALPQNVEPQGSAHAGYASEVRSNLPPECIRIFRAQAIMGGTP